MTTILESNRNDELNDTGAVVDQLLDLEDVPSLLEFSTSELLADLQKLEGVDKQRFMRHLGEEAVEAHNRALSASIAMERIFGQIVPIPVPTIVVIPKLISGDLMAGLGIERKLVSRELDPRLGEVSSFIVARSS